MALCRLRRKPWTFAFYALTRGLTQVILAVLLVAVWQFGVKGILVASLVSACVVFVVTIREYARDLVRNVDWSVGREMIGFGWPLIVGAFAFYALNLADRFFIRHYHGLADNGLYGVAFRYSQVVLVGVFAFRMGWPQWHYSWLDSDRHPEMVARGANWFAAGIGFLVVLVSAWILPLFHLIMPVRYWDATVAVAPLCLAAMATGAYAVTGVGLNVTKRVRLIPVIALAAGAVAVGLYFLLIPPFSYVGAAWATVSALWLMALLVGIVSQRIYPVPWDRLRLPLAIVTTVGLALAALAVDSWMPFSASLPVRVAITAAYPAALLLGGFLTAAERSRLRGLVGR
jgi:O-antigen/teichoic acid export membrane protein